jgi:DNA invertase Pin-like site-specific DNA recombinase
MTSFVALYRVSTARQAESGLGLEYQEWVVRRYINRVGGALVAEFTEQASGRGKVKDLMRRRPTLALALATCRANNATLLVSTMTRLARSLAFVSALMESDVRFVVADMPDINPFTLHIVAAMAEEEGRQIAHRIKAALAAAKARGVPLGWTMRGLVDRQKVEARDFVERLRGLVDQLADIGFTSSHDLARELNALGIHGPRGATWSPSTAWRLQRRLAGEYRERRHGG